MNSDTQPQDQVMTEATLTAIHPEAVEQARVRALPEAHLRLMVEAFEALADMTRARILYALLEQPLCVRDLAVLIGGVTESAISHQLRFLKDRRLVKAQRDGNVIMYAIDDHHVAALFREADYHADHVRRGLPDHP
jgi:DNA-binding transcriptional ArsR family regulator